MPLHRSIAPASIPDRETIEQLLGERNNHDKFTRGTRTLGELGIVERLKTGVVTWAKRQESIDGDPYGFHVGGAGNVAHPLDERMFDVLPPLFKQLQLCDPLENQDINQIRALLGAVASTEMEDIARQFSSDGEYAVIRDDDTEKSVRFPLGPMEVRLIKLLDVQDTKRTSFLTSARCVEANRKVEEAFTENPMPIAAQKYAMARHLHDIDDIPTPPKKKESYLRGLRASVQERYWTGMDAAGRAEFIQEAQQPPDESLLPRLDAINAIWPRTWNNGVRDPDFYWQHLRDTEAANEVWEMVHEPILIVTNNKNKVVFASIENAAQTIFGEGIAELMARVIDLWSFYTPIPFPETKRHVIDSYFRKKHPHLDMEAVTVDNLPNAKMGIAHYGCWATQGDRHGRRIYRTRDSKFPDKKSGLLDFCEDLFPDFYADVFGKATDLARFILEPLDPERYKQCREVFRNLPESQRISTGQADFLSLFALGINPHTQRHRDTNDVTDGESFLLTLGEYTGGHLCVPQLGLKVSYTPGTCAMIKGDALEHLVSDYDGTRFFVVGTNHEACQRHAFRNMGLLPALLPKRLAAAVEMDKEQEEEDLNTTCINDYVSDSEDDFPLTNKDLHGPGALDTSTETSSSRDGLV